MPRGRRPNAPTQAPNGSWYCFHPGLKRKVRLGATSFAAAVAEQQSFYGVADAPASPNPAVPSHSVPTGGGDDTLFNLDDDSPPMEKKDSSDASAADLLSSLSSSRANATVVSPPSPAPTAVTPVAPVPAPSHPYAYNPKAPKQQKGLTPEQSAKIANGLKKMVVNTNVVVMATAVQMFGRVPAPLDDDEIALLQMGWEMYLDELFAKAKLKPLHLVIVGNLMIAVSMWASGKPKEKPKAEATTKAAAPGHTASVTPIQPPKG